MRLPAMFTPSIHPLDYLKSQFIYGIPKHERPVSMPPPPTTGASEHAKRRADYGEQLIERLAAESKAAISRDQGSVAEQKRGNQ